MDSRFIRRKNKPAYVVGLLLALLSTTTEAKDEMKGGFLLNVVVAQSTTVFKLLAGKDQALLVRGNTNRM